MFKPLDNPADLPAMERRTLEFWRDNQVFEKSLEDRREAQPFVFFEGPPTANGRPHVGHVLPRAIKDLIPRFQTMEGRLVRRKAGWDTHGLPVELEVEKELGISGKPQIEEYGVEAFVERCRESVFRYKQEWEKVTERIGFWVDLEHPYVTYDNEYIESVWWALKQIWDRGLLYRGHKVVPYCPRCGTSLSSHEVAQGYREVEDPSVFVRFPVMAERSPAPWEGASFLVWTTTPWTLPSNAGLAVNPRETYVLAAVGDERLILAEARLDDALKAPYEVLERFPGQDLVGLRYRPVFDFFLSGSQGQTESQDRSQSPDCASQSGDGPFRVVSADFVSLEDKVAAYVTLFEVLAGLAGVLAPFVPFLAEELYQNLVRSQDNRVSSQGPTGPRQDPTAPVSVHLCAYPMADEGLIDTGLERRMEILRDLVVLGRAARSRGNLKTRFPLPRVHLIGEGVSEIGDLTDLLLEELNVKEAVVGSTLADVASVQVKPRFDLLGPRLGPRMSKVSAAVGTMSGEAALAALEGGGPVHLPIDGEEVVLTTDELDFRVKEKEGYLVEGNQRRRVGLDTRATPELRREGLAREMVNRIQQMRKEAGLDVDQLVEVGYAASGELALALADQRKYVIGETLATELKPAPLGLSGGSATDRGRLEEAANDRGRLEEAANDRPRLSGDGSAAWDLVREWTIEGHSLTLAIRRAGMPAQSEASEPESADSDSNASESPKQPGATSAETESISTDYVSADSGESRVAFKLVAGEREV